MPISKGSLPHDPHYKKFSKDFSRGTFFGEYAANRAPLSSGATTTLYF
jgi:hypothetical protein